MEIHGDFVYGTLKNEMGVHRLVRISPFSSKQLRHTSFALIEIVPILPDVEHKKLVIPPEDLKVELSRSSGPGGQNVNKRETAVRIVHLPTGISAGSQQERSQPQNKEKAEWGNQIRSYVLNPYKMVKDHRTGTQSSQPEKVLEGDLDKFIESELQL